MNKSELIELVKQVIKEENDYQQLFKHMLDKSGKSISSMSDEDKKKFFNAVDTAYKAKSEGRLRGYNEAELTAAQKQLDVDKDGDIGGDDLADLRTGKKVKSELTDKQKQIDVDKDGEIEGSDLAALRAKNEVGQNDWHFKAIMKMYDMAGSYGKKKIGVAVSNNPNASRREIERSLKDTDYDEVTDISDKLRLKEVFNKIAQKKKVNENLVFDIVATVGTILIAKVIFYYLIELAGNGINYLMGNKKETKKVLEKILGSLESNKKFIDDVVKLLDKKKGIDDSIASKMVKLPYVQTQITKGSDSTNGDVTESEIENELKNIFLKTWSQHSNKVIEKVKKDIK